MKKKKAKKTPEEVSDQRWRRAAVLNETLEAERYAAFKAQGFHKDPPEWTRLERASLTAQTVIGMCEKIMLLVARYLGTSPDPISKEAEKQLQMFLDREHDRRKK